MDLYRKPNIQIDSHLSRTAEIFRLQLVLNIYFIHIAKVITGDAAKFNLNLLLLLCKPSPVFAIRP